MIGVRRRAVDRRVIVIGVLAFAATVLLAAPAGAVAIVLAATESSLTVGKAAILGLVEGVTEYLPISSTGHLLVTSRMLGLPEHGKAGDALKAYEIAIQSGAILAVLGLYRHRFAGMIDGIRGRSDDGRRLLTALVVAFIPAAIVGVIGEKVIKDVLFGVGPVIAAWAVGGVAILVLVGRGILSPGGGHRLEALTTRDALIIGAAQIVAMWPGTSRSLVTIVAALLLGYSMAAAVEFSFLLGVITLGAATAFSVVKDGSLMLDSFGAGTLLVGLVVAFVAAVISVRWMVTYLQRHSLAVFGWYRLAVAALALVLIATGTI